MFGIIVMLILLSMFTFALSQSVPGGPWMQNADIPLPPEQVEAFKAKYGMDKPLWQQYLVWLGNAARLDFGRPFTAPELSVTQMIGKVLPYSALVGGLAALLAVTLGIILGMIAATADSLLDNIITGYSVFIATIHPSSWPISGYVFAARLLPAGAGRAPSVVAYALPATGGVARWTAVPGRGDVG